MENIVVILKDVERIEDIHLKCKLYLAESFSGEYSVHLICDTLNIPRVTFYNRILRNKKYNTWYTERKEELQIAIQGIYDKNRKIFGASKSAAIMSNNGIAVSEEMTRSLMKDLGIGSIRQSSKNFTRTNTKSTKTMSISSLIQSPNETPISDVTHFKLNDKAYYICVILDLFSR